MLLAIWLLLFTVAVFDVIEHRIPNALLLLILICQTLSIISLEQSFWPFIVAGVSTFVVSLLLFFLKAISPGDVKLVGVMGFVLGSEQAFEGMMWIMMGSGLVAIIYLFYNLSQLGVSNPFYFIKDSHFRKNLNYVDSRMNTGRYGSKLTMPFAPGLVTGLAMYFYF